MTKKYNHSEAFCLMKYRSDDGTEEEILWNSRDGVTPFVISLKSGKFATHVDWQQDKCVPNHKPKPGDRVFVDLSLERAILHAMRKKAEGKFGCNITDVMDIAFSYMKEPGTPDIIEIPEFE